MPKAVRSGNNIIIAFTDCGAGCAIYIYILYFSILLVDLRSHRNIWI